MSRILPLEITPSDVASMLALLDATSPYLDIEQGRAYFKLGDPPANPFPDIFVAFKDDENELTARRAAAEAITVLPYLHAWVVGLPDDPLYSDEYTLSYLEVDHGEIDVCYTPTVNATWRNPFRKDEAGRWRPSWDDSSVVKMPSPA